MNKLALSARNEVMQASPIRKLVPYANIAKSKGVNVFHLNIGQPDIATPDQMRESYKKIPEVIAYGPSDGILDFKRSISNYYRKENIKISEDELFITSGGSEAIIFSLMAITTPGDDILIPEPFYTNYNGFAAMVGVNIVPVPTTIETGFDLPDIKIFEKQLTTSTRAIVICNPGNPTGKVFSKEKLQQLVDFAKSNNLYIISDEVYREFTYDSKTTSILEFPDFNENAIVVDSVSKRFSACGARIGNIATRNKSFLQLVMKFGQARLCPPTIDQLAAKAAYDTPDQYLYSVKKEYQKRRDITYDMLKDLKGAVVPYPEGAFYMIISLPVDDAEKFAIFLLEEFTDNGDTVMVAPASGFYATPGRGKNEIRIAYVLKEDKLKRALTVLKKGIIAYNNRI